MDVVVPVVNERFLLLEVKISPVEVVIEPVRFVVVP